MEPEGGWSEYDVTLSSTKQQQHDAAAGVHDTGAHARPHDAAHTADHSHYHSHADIMKPLVRRRLQHQRDLAHSLVGTPNYIAPEVLARTGQYIRMYIHGDS